MPDNTINIDTTPQPQTISIDQPSAITSKLSPDAVEYRSDNAVFGLTNQSFFTKDDWSKAIQNGQEGSMRAAAAAKVNTDRAEMAKQLIDTHPNLSDSALKEALKYQDPKSVVEEHYAKSYMNYLDQTKPEYKDSWAYGAQLGLKDKYDWVKNAGSQIIAKDNYMLAWLQNDDATWSDVLGVVVPDIFTAGGYGEYQMRQNTAGTPWWYGIGVGSQLKEQSERLGQITDFDEWRNEFDRVYQSMPKAYRAGWVKDMIYKSDSSAIADNLMTGVNVAFGGKIATTFGKNIIDPAIREAAWNRATFRTHTSIDTAIAFDRMGNLINAITDMVKTRPANVPPSVAAPAAAGNLAESAVNIVKIDAINELYPNNNPLGSMINRLAALFDTDGRLAASDPGRLGREAANRLQDMYNTYKDDFTNVVFNEFLQRVDRTPTAELEKQLANIQKGLADLHRGVDNQVGNVSRGIWLPGYNNRLFNIAIISNDAELFKSVEEAMANARRNGWAVKGDYAVGPDERVNIFKKEALIKGYRTNAARAATPEGAARANALADKLQSELDKIPRHETGVTIESQFKQGPMYSSPIGPTMPPGVPRKPAGALKPTEGTAVPPGTTRFYHGSKEGRAPKEGDSRWVTQDPNYARNYTADGKPNNVHYVDIPNEWLEKNVNKSFDDTGTGQKAPYVHFEVPERFAKWKQIPEASNRAIWRSAGGDVPVNVFNEPVQTSKGTGKRYVHVQDKDGNHTYVPEDELFHHSTKPTDTSPTKYIPEATGAPKSRAQQIAEQGMDKTALQRISDTLNNRYQRRYLNDSQIEEWAKANPNGSLMDMYDHFGITLPEITAPEGYIWRGRRGSSRGKYVPSETSSTLRTTREGADAEFINDPVPDFGEPITPEQANQFWGMPSEVIKQQGNGYYILHTVFLPEDANFVKDGLLTSDYGGMTKEQFRQSLATGKVSTGLVPPDWSSNFMMGMLNRLGLASPSEVLSISENLNRNIATHGPSVLLGLIKKGLKPIEEMPRKYHNDFNRLLRFAQNDWNPETGTPGRWFNTMAEVDNWYQNNIRRQVTEQEVRAYFAYKALVLDDLNFRNLAVMSRKLAMGAKQHAVRYTDEYGQKVTSPFFEGVRLDRIPENGRALYLYEGGSKFDSISDLLNRPGMESLKDDLANGRAQIIHLMDSKSKPLRDIEQRGVDYVISYNTEEKPLGMDHVNRLGGGHRIPKWGWFIKQADVEVTPTSKRELHVYNGDKTLLSFRSKSDAREAMTYLEAVRDLLSKAAKFPEEAISHDIMRWETEGGRSVDVPLSEREKLINEAALLNRKTGIPFYKLEDMWMKPHAPFNVHEPLVVVPKGRKIIDMGEEGAALAARHRQVIKGTIMDQTHEMIDATKSDSLLGRVMTEFTQERDAEGLYTMTKKGTESNPWFAYESADLVDPITSMERGYKGIVNSMYMHDMKMFSMNHWLEQAAPYLENADTIRSNPLHHFYNPVYKKGIDSEVQWMLEGNRRNALDFVGLRSKYDTSLTRLGQSFLDSMFGRDRFIMPQLDELPVMTKFTDFLKGCGFYYYITSLKSFWTQAATMSYLYSVAGTENMQKSLAAMTMYGYYKINPKFLDAMDQLMVKHWNWEPGRFTEAVKMLDGSGFGHIGQEHAFKQGSATLGMQKMTDVGPWTMGTKVAMKGGKTLLDITSIPFDLGAATTRISGFFTAFLEHLPKAPGGVLDRQMQASILGRASLLDVNMSRAHNTRIQNNAFLSVPMQFMSYDIRMAQMMWGKNLSVEEKQRLFAMSSMLYGLRGGGLALFGFPLANATMKTLQQYGGDDGGPYIPGENSVKDIMVNGFPSWMFSMLSGFADPDGKKTFLDLSNWGNRGVDLIDKFFDRNSTLASIVAGAAGNALESAWENTWGLRRAAIDLGKEDNGYKATSDDWLRLFDTLAATRDFHQGWLALQTGKMLTDKGTYVTDQSKLETFMRLFFGVRKINQADTFAKQKVVEDYSQDIHEAQQHVNREMLLFAINGANGDESNARIHWQNANNIMRALIPESKHKEVGQSALRNIDESLEQRLNEKLNIQMRNDFETYRKLYTGK